MMDKTNTALHWLPIRVILASVAVALGVLLIAYEYLMLQWPMMREAHFLHYIAYLVNEHDFAPYRDVVETSWFGTFLFHMAIGKVFGYTSTAFRTADIVFLFSLLFLTWQLLRRLDFWLAWVGALSFGLAYLHYGPANTLQRDFVLLLPIVTSLVVAIQTQWTPKLRAILIGVCFGAAFSIKPHAVIGLPIVLALLYSQSGINKSYWRIILNCVSGWLGIISLGILWLWHANGLTAFIDMTLHYLPLYQDLNGAHQMTTSSERWQNSLHWWKYFLWSWPLSVAIGGLYGWLNTNKQSQQRAMILTLIALTVCYNIYPLVAGKFWDYHWIPYSYFAILSTSVLLLPPKKNSLPWRGLSLGLCLYFLQTLSSQYAPWQGLQTQLKRYPDVTVDQKFDEEVVAFIRQHLKKEDKIQIIEQGGPATLYLMKAGAVLATPYPGSFMFLHHVNEPYVQQAQQKFLSLVKQDPPALFMVMTDFTKPTGINTITEIPGLQDFLQEHYDVIWKHPAFTFWERKPESVNASKLP